MTKNVKKQFYPVNVMMQGVYYTEMQSKIGFWLRHAASKLKLAWQAVNLFKLSCFGIGKA